MKRLMIITAGVLLTMAIGVAIVQYVVTGSYGQKERESQLQALGLADVTQRYATHFGFLDAAEQANDMIALGIVWDRPHPCPFIWEEVGLGNYNWGRIDSYVRKAQNNGMMTLATIWPFNDQDQKSCHGAEPEGTGIFRELPSRLYAPCDQEAYQRFISAMVERYDGDGTEDFSDLRYGIKHWEVSNEPELQGENLTFFQGSAGDYAQLLIMTSKAIRAADPEAKILHAGAAGLVVPASEPFWRTVFATEGVGEAFDIANIHSLSQSKDMYVSDWKQLLTESGLQKPIWVTEAQFGSFLPIPPPTSGQPYVPADEVQKPLPPDQIQKELVKDGVLLAFAHGAEKIFWTTFRAPKFAGPNTEEFQEVAFVDTDGNNRPAYDVLADYVQKLNRFSTVEVFTPPDPPERLEIRFVTPQGDIIYPLP